MVILETEFKDENLPVGTHTYQVSAVSDLCNETAKTEEVSITILPEYCEPPIDIEVNKEEGSNNVIITWKEPANIDRELEKYVIIRNEDEIGNTPPDVLIYTDTNVMEGEYFYKLMAVYVDCESDYSEEIPFVMIGINNIHANTFHIFPNPTSGEFVIQSSMFEVQSVEIYDVMGKKQSTHHLITSSSNHHITSSSNYLINVSHLQSGVYFVKIFAEENQIAIKKLIINR